ncbi:MAG: Regulatory protein RecX [Calditrichaeota bacterium]|nr:Regulatory protein RecX [Calditrichota bacterium]
MSVNKPRANLSAYDRALRLLARRDHSTAELRRKLAQRDHPPGEIDGALARLRELNYVDDERTAATWAEQEARRGGQGRAKALARMIEHGLPSALASAALAVAWDDELEREHARAVVARWVDANGRPETAKQRARLARHLAVRGFEHELIGELLAGLGTESGPFD